MHCVFDDYFKDCHESNFKKFGIIPHRFASGDIAVRGEQQQKNIKAMHCVYGDYSVDQSFCFVH